MALITEDGTGKPDAESYVSVSEAQSYFLANGEPAAWMQARDDKKETALRIATRAIDLTYSGRWQGYRYQYTQALSWPRWGVYDEDGYAAIATAPLPKYLKTAVASLALRWLQDPDSVLGDVDPDDGSIVSESVSVGPISESKTYTGSKRSKVKFPEIEKMIAPLLSSGVGTFERA